MNLKLYSPELITTYAKTTKKLKRQNVFNNLKRKAIDDVFENPRKLLNIVSYHMELSVHGQQITQHVFKKGNYITHDQSFIPNYQIL